MRLVLASASPRRQALLQEHGFEFTVHVVDVDEVAVDFLSVRELVLLNAVKKARAASRFHPSAVVLAADTLVALEGKALGKPDSLDQAREMLWRLSGHMHQVFTGVSLVRRSDGKTRHFVVSSNVRFRKLTAADIEEYFELVNPLDKAGAYAAQEHAEHLIARVDGSWTNVVGLPMERLQEALPWFEHTVGKPG